MIAGWPLIARIRSITCHAIIVNLVLIAVAAPLHVLHVQVTGGSALGIVSAGTDSLMATTVQGPAVAGGGYSGAALPGQQNGVMGPQAESGNQQPPAKKSSAETGASSTVVKVTAGLAGLLLPALL